MPEPLTERQAAILRWVVAYIERFNYPPTVREIASAFGIRSTNGMTDHLLALQRKGWVHRDKGLSRGLRVLYVPTPPPSKEG